MDEDKFEKDFEDNDWNEDNRAVQGIRSNITVTSRDSITVPPDLLKKSRFHPIYLFFRCLWINNRVVFILAWPTILFLILRESFSSILSRLMFMFLLMLGYWLTYTIPSWVTSLLPIAFFPPLGIMRLTRTIECYFRQPNLMMLGGLIFSLAVRRTHLHLRVGLLMMQRLGKTPFSLIFGLVILVMILAMILPGVASFTLVFPMVKAILNELKVQNSIRALYRQDVVTGPPSSFGVFVGITIAYAAITGSVCNQLSADNEVAFQAVFLQRFPYGVLPLGLLNMLINIPLAICITLIQFGFCSVILGGALRPQSKAATEVSLIRARLHEVNAKVRRSYKRLGGLTFGEVVIIVSIVVLFVGSLLPLKQYSLSFNFGIILVLFLMPEKPYLWRFFRLHTLPKRRHLLSWKKLSKEISWNVILLLGGSLALCDAALQLKVHETFMDPIVEWMEPLQPVQVKMCCMILTSLVATFVYGVTAVEIVTPAVMNLSVKLKLHPFYLSLPSAISSGFSYSFPYAEAVLAILVHVMHIPRRTLFMVSFFVLTISLGLTFLWFIFIERYVVKWEQFPRWAVQSKRM